MSNTAENMEQHQELITAKELRLNANIQREREILVVEREFAMTQRRANMLACSTVVPKEYQNNIANCVIAIEIAQRLRATELEVMQNLDIIQGKPSFSAKYLIALVNNSGILKGRLKFRFTGERGTDTWGCQAYGICSETGEELPGTEITIAIAKAEGWYTKNGSKWQTIPELMLQYRAAAFWSRVYAPDATMGMHTSDEINDISDQQPKLKDVSGEVVGVSSLNDAFTKKQTEESEPESESEKTKQSEAVAKPEQVKSTPATNEIAHSPAYEQLVKYLNEAESIDQAKALNKHNLITKINQKEKADFLDLVENKVMDFAAAAEDQAPSAEGMFNQ